MQRACQVIGQQSEMTGISSSSCCSLQSSHSCSSFSFSASEIGPTSKSASKNGSSVSEKVLQKVKTTQVSAAGSAISKREKNISNTDIQRIYIKWLRDPTCTIKSLQYVFRERDCTVVPGRKINKRKRMPNCLKPCGIYIWKRKERSVLSPQDNAPDYISSLFYCETEILPHICIILWKPPPLFSLLVVGATQKSSPEWFDPGWLTLPPGTWPLDGVSCFWLKSSGSRVGRSDWLYTLP